MRGIVNLINVVQSGYAQAQSGVNKMVDFALQYPTVSAIMYLASLIGPSLVPVENTVGKILTLVPFCVCSWAMAALMHRVVPAATAAPLPPPGPFAGAAPLLLPPAFLAQALAIRARAASSIGSSSTAAAPTAGI